MSPRRRPRSADRPGSLPRTTDTFIMEDGVRKQRHGVRANEGVSNRYSIKAELGLLHWSLRSDDQLWPATVVVYRYSTGFTRGPNHQVHGLHLTILLLCVVWISAENLHSCARRCCASEVPGTVCRSCFFLRAVKSLLQVVFVFRLFVGLVCRCCSLIHSRRWLSWVAQLAAGALKTQRPHWVP